MFLKNTLGNFSIVKWICWWKQYKCTTYKKKSHICAIKTLLERNSNLFKNLSNEYFSMVSNSFVKFYKKIQYPIS